MGRCTVMVPGTPPARILLGIDMLAKSFRLLTLRSGIIVRLIDHIRLRAKMTFACCAATPVRLAQRVRPPMLA